MGWLFFDEAPWSTLIPRRAPDRSGRIADRVAGTDAVQAELDHDVLHVLLTDTKHAFVTRSISDALGPIALFGLSDSLTVGWSVSLRPPCRPDENGANAHRRAPARGKSLVSSVPHPNEMLVLPSELRRADLLNLIVTSRPSLKMTRLSRGSSPRDTHQSIATLRRRCRIAAVDADARPAGQPIRGFVEEPLGAVGVRQDDAQGCLRARRCQSLQNVVGGLRRVPRHQAAKAA